MAFQSGAFQSPGFQQLGSGAPAVQDQGAGRAKRRRYRERYVARYKGTDHEFATLEDLETFVESARVEQSARPKRQRAVVRISLAPDFAEDVAEVIQTPKRLYSMPPSAAMAQVRRIDAAMLRARVEDDDEVLLWLM